MDDFTFYHIPRTSGKTFVSVTGISSVLHFPDSFSRVTPMAKAITVLRNPADRHFAEWKNYGPTLLGDVGRIMCPEYVDAFAQAGIVDQDSFVACALTQNSQTKFLLGKPLYTTGEVTDVDLAPIFERIEDGTLLPCVFEQLPAAYMEVGEVFGRRILGGGGSFRARVREPSPIPASVNAVDQLLYDTVVARYSAQVSAAHATLLSWMAANPAVAAW